jgi:hypothetical protein
MEVNMTEEKRKERLIKEINKKRRQLDDFAKKKGLNHDATIKCSQELDRLILEWLKVNHF